MDTKKATKKKTSKKAPKKATKKKVTKRTSKKKVTKKRNPDLLDKLFKRKKPAKHEDSISIKVKSGTIMVTGMSNMQDVYSGLSEVLNNTVSDLKIEFTPLKSKKSYILNKEEVTEDEDQSFFSGRRGRGRGRGRI